MCSKKILRMSEMGLSLINKLALKVPFTKILTKLIYQLNCTMQRNQLGIIMSTKMMKTYMPMSLILVIMRIKKSTHKHDR